MDDFLIADGTFIGQMKIMGRDVGQSTIRAYHVLWTNISATTDIAEVKIFVERLMQSQTQLNLGRESAGRAGADTALTAVLSWYEDISLDTLMNVRTGSHWVEDPEFVSRC